MYCRGVILIWLRSAGVYCFSGMKIIYNRFIPVNGFGSMTFLWWIFRRVEAGVPTARSLRHETIHSKQHVEVLCLGLVLGLIVGCVFDFSWLGCLLWFVGSLFSYYILYILFWVLELVLPPYSSAYRDICFEVEAYAYEDDEEYLRRRVPFLGWIVGIWDKRLRVLSRSARRGFIKK